MKRIKLVILSLAKKSVLPILTLSCLFVNTQTLSPASALYVIGVGSNSGCGTPNCFNSPVNTRANVLARSQQFTVGIGLDSAIKRAIDSGYTRIYIQRGHYVISKPIILSKDNVTIEGESNLTIIKPQHQAANGLFPSTQSMIIVSGKNMILKNFNLDPSLYTTGILSAIELNSGAENNTFESISIMNISSTPANITCSKAPIYLRNNSSFIRYNTFRNILLKQVNKGILLDGDTTRADGIGHNIFQNVTIDRPRENGIEFVGTSNSYKPFRNTFEDFSIQPTGTLPTIVKGVVGSRNIFNKFRVADWKKAGSSNGLAISISPSAWGTIVSNFEIGNNKVHASTDDIADSGIITQQLFNERAGVMYNRIGFNGFNNGSNNKSLTEINGGVVISGQQGTNVNYYTRTADVGKVLTCTDTFGRAVWSTPTFTNPCTTVNMLSKTTSSGAIGCSQVFDNGTNVGIGTTTPLAQLHTTGSVRFAGITSANHNRIMTQDVNGNVFWRDASTLGSANISANQGVTLSGNQVLLGDTCGGNGAPFTRNREINLSDFNLYFNSKSSTPTSSNSNGKVYIGTNLCQTLQSRLEISTKGQTNSPVNNYLSPNPSASGLRFTELTMNTQPVPNKTKGVLSLDQDGDVIWVVDAIGNTTNNCTTVNYVPKVTGTNSYGCSQIFDNGTSVGVSTAGPFTYTTAGAAWTAGSPAASGTAKFSVNGLGRFTSLLVTSDMTLKKDILSIENPNAIIEKLQGKTYAWKDEVVKETLIDNGRHYGFLAQEVEKVMPEAVIKDEKGRYAVEYNAFIPVLVESQKLLIKENNDLKSELNDLKTELKELKEMILNKGTESKDESSSAILYQNVPNPFSSSTTIKYYVPKCIGECKIIVSDVSGKLIYTHSIEKSGEGSFQFDGSRLSSTGNFIYSLIVDGKAIANKKMLLVAH